MDYKTVIEKFLQDTTYHWMVVGNTSSGKKIIEVFYSLEDLTVGPFSWTIFDQDYRPREHLETLLTWTNTALFENFDSWRKTDGREAFGEPPSENSEDQDLKKYIRQLKESVELRKLLDDVIDETKR